MGVFELFLEWFISPFLNWLSDLIGQSIFVTSFNAVFHVEDLCGLGPDVLMGINAVILGFATLLLTLKLLWKLFNVYYLGVDGDESVTPFEYLKSYGKGLVIMATFTVAYTWLMEVLQDFTQQILDVVGAQSWDNGYLLTSPGNITFNLIFLLIYAIFMIIVMTNCFMNGIRMLVLRVAIPLSCVGLIDNDNGIYAVFLKKMFQTAVTASAQIILVQFSLLPLKSTSGGILDATFLPYLMAIGFLAYSLKLPNDLNEVFLTGAATGAGQKVSALGRGAMSVAGFLRGGR